MTDWIPRYIERGEAYVYCKTCGEQAEWDSHSRKYECDCRFGVTPAALALGIPGYAAYDSEVPRDD